MLKILLISVFGIVMSCIVLSLVYIHNIKICEKIVVTVNSYSNNELFAISPTGGKIEFRLGTNKNELIIENRYIKDIYISNGDVENFKANLSIGDESVDITQTSLLEVRDKEYRIKRDIFPEIGFLKKISFFKQNIQVGLLKYHWNKSKKAVFCFLFFLILTYLGFLLFRYLKNNFKRLSAQLFSFLVKSVDFIKANWLKIIALFLISAVVPLIYLLFDKHIVYFLNLSVVEYILMFGVVIFPLSFMAYFSKTFKLNSYYWISLLVIFVLLVFVLKPLVYLYSFGFRDDISKFFVKANGESLLTCLFTPDSGYLNFFQNLTAYVLLRIFGFRQYFPEALQLTVALSFSALFASFNLKSLRVFIKSDKYRFFISLILSISPLMFFSSSFLFEVPFVAAAFLLLFYFVGFQKKYDQKDSGINLLIIVSVIMFLSKPIYIILLPVLVALMIYQFFVNKNKRLTATYLFLVAFIIVQMIVVFLFKDQIEIKPSTGLGTVYDSAFLVDNHSFVKLLPTSIILFFRQFVKILGIPTIKYLWVNIVINITFILFVGALILHYAYKIFKKRDVFVSLFCLSALLISFMSVVLFVNSTYSLIPSKINTGNQYYIVGTFYDMIRYSILPPTHRYLLISSFLTFIVLCIFLFEIADKYLKSTKLVNLTKIVFLLLFAGVQFWSCKDFVRLHQFDGYEKESYWRSFNSLIFSNQEYYIPYNGFPEQKHCIKSGIDKIIDVNDLNGNTIVISELYPETNNWRIIQIILINSDPHDFPIVSGETFGNGDKNAELINGKSQNTKALVYKFDNLYKFDKINISYLTPEKKYTGLVRIIGKYEK